MNKKRVIATGIIIFMLTAATGCSEQETASPNTVLSIEDESKEGIALPDENHEMDISPKTDPDDSTSNNFPANASRDTIIIGGKVRSVTEDSFVISRVLIEDSDDGASYISIPEEGSQEEELTTIYCTDTTTFEHWTIQGGGAGITTDEATFSDIQSDSTIEAEGYFDGEEFIAEKVIIETYE